MNDEKDKWVKYIPVLITTISLLTALTAYVESNISTMGTEYLNDATARLVVANNSYTSHVIHVVFSNLAKEMTEAWYEITDHTGDETSLIQAQSWEKLANEEENASRIWYDRYREKMDEGFYPAKEDATKALTKASGFVIPIILFQISTTLLVTTQMTKKKVLLVLSLGTTIVGAAYILSLAL